MSLHEYNEAIRAMEKLTRAEETEAMRILKSKRSAVLHQMQLSGVDTADWKRVDAFCLDKRIAGKRFARLDYEELEALLKKIRAIRRETKGGGLTMARYIPLQDKLDEIEETGADACAAVWTT